MKKIFILFYILFTVNFLNAQTITTDPIYPVSTLPVTLTFNAVGTGLEGYTGDVYAHTGVTIEGVGQWQHVIGSWGDNLTQPKLTSTGTNTYELVINTSINDFYGVLVGETVTEICIVFRSADKSKQTSDLFLNVYSPYVVSINQPDSTSIYSVNDNVDISAVALFANSMKIFVNDIEVASSLADNILHTVVATQTGKNSVKVEATDGTLTLTDLTYFFVRDNNVIEDLPSPDLVDGINYIDPNTVTLVLYAPFKNFVYVKGSFNNWELSSSNQMKQTTDGNTYWITLTGLTSGQEYAYQYVIDGNLTVADTYSDKILDPWNDQYISDETYPGLFQYPDGKTTGIVSVFQTNQTPYTWNVSNFTKPAKEKLVIYELHIRDFIAKQNYQTLIDTIAYLKNLGITAIELMPVNEFEGNSSWGYNPAFHFAPDKAYGTKDKLKEFIDVCHTNGIAVIMDIVLNHSYGQLPLVQMYFDPEAGDYGQPSANNPWFNQTSPNTSYSWGYDFNHESLDTKKYVSRVVKYWLTDYKFDGFRFDFTKGFTNTVGDGWAYDQSRIDILKQYADIIWTAEPEAYVILEHFADNSEEKILSDYGMMIWGNITYAYAQASMGFVSGSDIDWISYKNRGWTNPSLVGYMESHDEERMMFRNLNFGNSSGDYDIREKETALQRAELAGAFFFTVPGPKMIWQFEELGYDVSIDDPCRVCDKPLHWEYYLDQNRFRLMSVFKELIKLKNENEVFSTDNFTITDGVVKKIVLEHTSGNSIVIGNFGTSASSAIPNFVHTGMWYDFFSGAEFNIQNADTAFNLAAGEFYIFTDFKLEKPLIPSAPIATDVYVEGDITVGSTIQAKYTYSDANDDIEGETQIQWYSATSEAGNGIAAIESETGTEFTIPRADYGKYYMIKVTPKSLTTDLSTGLTASSILYGPVRFAPAEKDPLVRPNLSSDIIYVDNISAYSEVKVVDIMGHVINIISTEEAKENGISIINLPRGIYYVRLEGTGDPYSIKFIKY